MDFGRFTEPKRLGRRLLAAHLSVVLLLAGCKEPSSQLELPTPTVAPRPFDSGTRSFFAGDLVSEDNNLHLIVECLHRNGNSLIDFIDYSRDVVVLRNGAEMPLKGPSKSVATVVGDPETDLAVLASFQGPNSGTMFLRDGMEFVEGVSAKSFRTRIIEADLPIDPYSNDALVEKKLPGQIVDLCYQ